MCQPTARQQPGQRKRSPLRQSAAFHGGELIGMCLMYQGGRHRSQQETDRDVSAYSQLLGRPDRHRAQAAASLSGPPVHLTLVHPEAGPSEAAMAQPIARGI
jgi:hypothetical protein